ncbi:guanine-N(7)-methyltransferase [Ramaria rubella]|nr:guanine-N(7)-methyltransferase [Ramaria rubella]
MPRGARYDPLRDVLAHSPTQLKPHITNLLNNDPLPQESRLPPHRLPPHALSPVAQPAPMLPVPYNPTTRRTPPTSVLVPLTPAELESFKAPRHALRARAGRPDPALQNPNFFPPPLRDKRKREDDEEERAAKRTRDSGLVVEHYNSRPDVGVAERRESPIIGLKNFNNWIKSVLIAKFAMRAFDGAPSALPGERMRGKVLDMGCGKGGDLQKWQKARVKEYVGLDIAAVSVDQARTRWAQLRHQRFDAQFAALDCYTEPITSALPASVFTRPFDAVSMQFCMHYAFESVSKARMMLENVSKHLRTGGVFLGTVPNADFLLGRLNALPPGAPPKFGNAVFQIRFEDRETHAQPFGHRYWFYLKDAVEDVPEYVVHWPHFQELAREYGLHQLYREEFHDIFAAEREHRDYGPLLQRMKVVSASGESQMDEDQWDAANIYLAFAFEKR